MAIPLVAPISAEVLEITDAYIEAVRAGEAPGDGDDWLVRLAAHETLDSVPGLYRGEQALLWYLRKIQLVKRYLREAMAQGDASVVGTTLTDGGAPVVNLEEVLGGSGFEGLVEEMFRMQI
jgi:hypothetical protein